MQAMKNDEGGCPPPPSEPTEDSPSDPQAIRNRSHRTLTPILASNPPPVSLPSPPEETPTESSLEGCSQPARTFSPQCGVFADGGTRSVESGIVRPRTANVAPLDYSARGPYEVGNSPPRPRSCRATQTVEFGVRPSGRPERLQAGFGRPQGRTPNSIVRTSATLRDSLSFVAGLARQCAANNAHAQVLTPTGNRRATLKTATEPRTAYPSLCDSTLPRFLASLGRLGLSPGTPVRKSTYAP